MVQRGYNTVVNGITSVFSGPSARRGPVGPAPAIHQNYTEQEGEFSLPGVDVLGDWWNGFNRTIQQGAQRVQSEWKNFQTAPTLFPTQRTAVVWTVDAVVDIGGWAYDTVTGTGKTVWDGLPMALPPQGREAYFALERSGALPEWAPRPVANIVEPVSALSDAAGNLAGRVVRGDPTLVDDAAEVGEKVWAWGKDRYTGANASRNIRHDIATGGAEVLSFLIPAKWLRTANQAADAGRALNHLDEAGDLAKAGQAVGALGRYGRFNSADELAAEAFTRYQSYYDEGYERFKGAADRGALRSPGSMPIEVAIGQETDAFARGRMRAWLREEGIAEGPQGVIRVNRRLYDPDGSGRYRIPDVYIPDARLIMDGSLTAKTAQAPQVMDFHTYSGSNVTIVQPTQVGPSYSFPRRASQ